MSSLAQLKPQPTSEDLYEKLVVEGSIIPAKRKLSELGPPPPIQLDKPLSRLLEIDRSEG
jgi:hypothetical protein